MQSIPRHIFFMRTGYRRARVLVTTLISITSRVVCRVTIWKRDRDRLSSRRNITDIALCYVSFCLIFDTLYSSNSIKQTNVVTPETRTEFQLPRKVGEVQFEEFIVGLGAISRHDLLYTSLGLKSHRPCECK